MRINVSIRSKHDHQTKFWWIEGPSITRDDFIRDSNLLGLADIAVILN